MYTHIPAMYANGGVLHDLDYNMALNRVDSYA